jgi:hypothetical protein
MWIRWIRIRIRNTVIFILSFQETRIFVKAKKGMKILKISSESRLGHVHFGGFFLASNDGWIDKKKKKDKYGSNFRRFFKSASKHFTHFYILRLIQSSVLG